MTGLLQQLQQFYDDKRAALVRHEAGARLISQYDINNTYQYIINREETQLSWLAAAITDLGGTVDDAVAESDYPSRNGRDQTMTEVLQEDASQAQAFVDRWKPSVDDMTHARHQGMLRVVLGETLEQKRFFERALAGDINLLGRRTAPVGARIGRVLSTRWIE